MGLVGAVYRERDAVCGGGIVKIIVVKLTNGVLGYKMKGDLFEGLILKCSHFLDSLSPEYPVEF